MDALTMVVTNAHHPHVGWLYVGKSGSGELYCRVCVERMIKVGSPARWWVTTHVAGRCKCGADVAPINPV